VQLLKQFRRSCLDKALKTLDKNIPTRAERDYGTLCFSQSGEDGILNYLLPSLGFFIDIGAHHPLRYSNTHMLYRRGWRGINIDPIPGVKKLFDYFRPNDINLEIAVGSKKKKAHYYSFEEGCYNTMDRLLAKDLIEKGISKFLGVTDIDVHPLKRVCRQHVPAGQKIDLLTVDAEGMDSEILQTHDWRRYRPMHVVVENHWKYHRNRNPCAFLRKCGYRQVGCTPLSAIFQDSDKSR